MFKFISPQNQIVVDYDKDDFVFLGARSMKSGKVYLPSEFQTMRITVPRMIPVNMIDEYLDEKHVEGVVITMKDGLMFKMKSSEYFQRHKLGVKADFKRADQAVSMIVDSKIDDGKGILPKRKCIDALERIKTIEMKYIKRYDELESLACNFLEQNKDLTRRDMAVKINRQTLFGKQTGFVLKILMKIIDGREYRDMVDSKIVKESKEWTM